MKRVEIAELRDQLSRHLRAVEGGEEIEVTDRDRPIARIVPIEEHEAPLAVVPAKRPFASVRGKHCSPAGWAISSLELLREERRER